MELGFIYLLLFGLIVYLFSIQSKSGKDKSQSVTTALEDEDEDSVASFESCQMSSDQAIPMSYKPRYRASIAETQPVAPSATKQETSLPNEPDTESEYAISSAEEARRAIIWSEILQRKY